MTLFPLKRYILHAVKSDDFDMSDFFHCFNYTKVLFINFNLSIFLQNTATLGQNNFMILCQNFYIGKTRY